MDAIPESASAYALSLIDSRSALSIRVCQPRPVDLKWLITSGNRTTARILSILHSCTKVITKG
jgi:hypothetical protein